VSLRSEPIFNVPPVVTATLAVLGAIHAVRELVLSTQADNLFLLLFAFIPARYETAIVVYPGGLGADIWSFLTYAFIHADVTHLGLNAVWLLAFASPVAQRFGTLRFIAFFAMTAVAGALAHLATHSGDQSLMVGASAAISGFMAAAIRFAFQRGGSLALLGAHDERAYRVKAAPLHVALRDTRILMFLAAWFGINVLVGSGLVSVTGGEQSIAWQAHIGGFVAGLVGFAVFDPIDNTETVDGDDESAADAEATPPGPG
jgi:membrane associated rhomboid family serine protease